MTSKPLHFIKKPNYTRIGKDRVIRLKYALFDANDGSTIEFRDDLYYLHGGYGGAFAKVEEALEGLDVGAKTEVLVDADEGYGRHDPNLLLKVAEEEIPPEGRQLGATLDGEAEGEVIKFRVVEKQGGLITLDANHPLAGRDLRFMFEVLDVRPASDEELAAGHAIIIRE